MKLMKREVDPSKQLLFRLPVSAQLRQNFDAQKVEYALMNGITDRSFFDMPGFMPYEGHYSVKLNGGVTKEQLIAFIAETRPLKDIDAFFKADKAGLVTLKYEGQRLLYHRDPK